MTKRFKVYGTKIANWKSFKDDFGENGKTRIINYLCSDVTGTNEYVIVEVTRDTEDECYDEFNGQYTDGAFENETGLRFEEI